MQPPRAGDKHEWLRFVIRTYSDNALRAVDNSPADRNIKLRVISDRTPAT